MAENIAFSITIGGVDREIKTMQDLKRAIKDANNELLQAGEVGTQSYADAQKKVADLKDRLGDLGDAAKVQGTAVERLGASTGLLKEGFTNLDLDKIKLGFQGLGSAMKAIPIFLIVEGIRLLIENFDKVVEFTQKLFNIVDLNKQNVEISKEAYEGEKKKLEVLNNQDNVLKLQGKSEKEILQLKIEQTAKAIEAGKTNLKATELQLKAEEDLAEKRSGWIKTAIRMGIESTLMMIRVLAAPIDLIITGYNKVASALGKDTIPLINDKLSEYAAKATDIASNMIIDPEKIRKENQKTLDEQKAALAQLENQKAGYQISINNMDKKAGQDAKALRDERLKQERESLDELNRLKAKNIQDAKQRELEVLRVENEINVRGHKEKKASQEVLNQLDVEYQNNRQAIIDKYQKIEDDKQKALDEKIKQDRIKANKDAYDEEERFNELRILQTKEGTKERLDAEIEAINTRAQHEINTGKKTAAEIALIKKKAGQQIDKLQEEFDDKEIKEEYKKAYKIISRTDQTFKTLGDLSTIFYNTKLNHAKKGSAEEEKILKQQFEVNKAFQIANAIINGATAVTGILASTGSKDALGIIGAIRIAAAIATTAAQISTIERTRFESAAPQTPETPSMNAAAEQAPTGTPQMPQTRTEQGTFLNEQGQTTGRLDTRVYVLESDITSTQRDVNRVKTQSKV